MNVGKSGGKVYVGQRSPMLVSAHFEDLVCTLFLQQHEEKHGQLKLRDIYVGASDTLLLATLGPKGAWMQVPPALNA